MELLTYLNDNLNNQYEIYYEPFLNLTRPDIVIVKRHYGVFIIEVKDWNLSKYTKNGNQFCVMLPTGNQTVRNPLSQVSGYTAELSNIISENPVEEISGYKNNLKYRFKRPEHFFSSANVFIIKTTVFDTPTKDC